ncbi:MAG: hypothetical protein AUJ23_03090 [Candidatus Magasanikbacteria bacterium CG1_02_32_51]|uniref:Damage-inducible protein J n=1 Tax=Candidatus Magasanikbacteria bacterium CG1_02_32_51 TaxID=1805238 RepID=A0A1J4U4C7_9BACT|nr:MAG: hypothetical protein AUJ23_03090 [Candidatus Magasanikbacteria bacterium CG1_02_32_51]
MKTATITIKVKPEIKKKAMIIADDLGFNLSTLVNAYLSDLIRNRTVHFSNESFEPTKELIVGLKESEKERKKGNVHTFETVEESLAFIKDIAESNNKV